jgi:CRP-like cAMP-binding protein
MSLVLAATTVMNVAKDRSIDDHPFVAKLSAHAPLDRDDLKALGRLLKPRLSVSKGKDILVQGYEQKGIDIIESGFAIRYTILRKGGRQIVNMLLPGDIVGFPTSSFARSIFSVMAVTKMTVHQLSFDAFVHLCKDRPNVAMALICFGAREASIYAHHLIDASRRSPLERIAHFILEMHARLKAIGYATENTLEIPLSQESIGDAVGLSAPHVNRMLGELKGEGLIAMKGHEITILDRTALQILAEFDPLYLARTSFIHRKTGGSEMLRMMNAPLQRGTHENGPDRNMTRLRSYTGSS